MPHKTIISVIIPVYNCEKYLKECIDSVLAQSFENFELILINDGSKDSSLAICNSYAQMDLRVRVIDQANHGAAMTRKKGVDISKGEYITFIDSDDYIEKDYLKTLYTNLIESKADFICCNSIDIGLKIQSNNCIQQSSLVSDTNQLLRDYFNGMRYAYCIWGKLFNKELFYNIVFPNLKYAEDTCVILSLFMKTNAIFLLNYSGYYYRCQENGVTLSINKLKQKQDLLYRANLIYDICKNRTEELYQRAQSELINSLYGLTVAYCLYGNKIDFDIFYQKCKENYSLINPQKVKVKKDKIKQFILYNFIKHRTFVKYIIKIVYFNRK